MNNGKNGANSKKVYKIDTFCIHQKAFKTVKLR